MVSDWAPQELKGARLWDGRCRQSLSTICERLVRQPELSFSAACGTAARQAAHRIFEHPETTVAGLLAGHGAQTAQRCRAYDLILAVQDSTEFEYTSHKQTAGLGPLGHGFTRGLMGHTVLAVTPAQLPLGILHMAIWARDPAKHGQRHTRRQRPTAAKESQKWIEGLQATEAMLPPDQPVVLLADREADVFAYLAAPRRANTHLLVRACRPRTVVVDRPVAAGGPQRGSLLTVARSAPVVGRMSVTVPRHPGQHERVAQLELRETTAQVQPPLHRKAGEPGTPQTVRIVCATEVAPAPREKAIQWILVTTLPGGKEADAGRVVRYYACRWVIERWHYTLKSGCRVEKLQIDDAASLKNALAVYGMVAWRLLWLTQWARVEPKQPAGTVVDAEERAVLEQASGRQVETVQEVVRAIARLGGFAGSPSEGEPGVKSVWLGLRRLAAMVEGWRLALQSFPATIHG
jgi:Transposase Tn5 dimerisation domain/Transposase DNA-binding